MTDSLTVAPVLPAHAQGSSQFLKLPIELRNQIYEYLLPWNDEKHYQNPWRIYMAQVHRCFHGWDAYYGVDNYNCWRSVDHKKFGYCQGGNRNFWRRNEYTKQYEGWSCPQILRTCSQIHAEATDLLFGGSTIDLDVTADGIALFLNHRVTDTKEKMEQTWYTKFLDRFDFARPKQVNIKVHISTFKNPMQVLRWRESISSLVELLGKCGGKIRNLHIELEESPGHLFVPFETIAERSANHKENFDLFSDVLHQSFPEQAPDLELILGPLRLLRVDEEAEVVLRRNKISVERACLFEELGYVKPGDLDALVNAVNPPAFETIAKSLETSMKVEEPGSVDLSTQVTRQLVSQLDGLTTAIREGYRLEWECTLPGYSCCYDCNGHGDWIHRRDMLVKWVRIGWHHFLDMETVNEDLEIHQACLDEILRGVKPTHNCGQGWDCEREQKEKKRNHWGESTEPVQYDDAAEEDVEMMGRGLKGRGKARKKR